MFEGTIISRDNIVQMIDRGFLFLTGATKAGTGHKMLFVPFVFSKSCFQGPAFRCDKIVVIVTLLEAIEGIPDKDYNFWGNENFHNLYERLLHKRKLKSGYLERTTALKSEPFVENQSEHVSKLSLHQSLVNVSLFTAISNTSQEQE